MQETKEMVEMKKKIKIILQWPRKRCRDRSWQVNPKTFPIETRTNLVLADLWGKRENEEVSTMEGESLIRKEEGDKHRSMSGAVLKDGADLFLSGKVRTFFKAA